jgi:hypothetical protein
MTLNSKPKCLKTTVLNNTIKNNFSTSGQNNIILALYTNQNAEVAVKFASGGQDVISELDLKHMYWKLDIMTSHVIQIILVCKR